MGQCPFLHAHIFYRTPQWLINTDGAADNVSILLYSILPVGWTGRCARVQAILPIMVLPLDFAEKRRHRRAADTAPTFKPTTAKEYKYKLDPKIQIDSIGHPRGIPNKFKDRNEITAGFE